MKTFRIYSPKRINSSEPSIHAKRVVYGGNPDNPYIDYIEIEAEDIGDEYYTMKKLHKLVIDLLEPHEK